MSESTPRPDSRLSAHCYDVHVERILELLSELGIPFERFDHPAVFSCEESERLCPPMPGVSTKQLFLAEQKGERVFLVIVTHDKKVDMKALSASLGSGRLEFGSPDLMKDLLGVTPGSVTPFGLLFDTNHRVEVFIDEDAWNAGTFQFHPLVNTATLIIDRQGLETWLGHTGHAHRILAIPRKLTSEP